MTLPSLPFYDSPLLIVIFSIQTQVLNTISAFFFLFIFDKKVFKIALQHLISVIDLIYNAITVIGLSGSGKNFEDQHVRDKQVFTMMREMFLCYCNVLKKCRRQHSFHVAH